MTLWESSYILFCNFEVWYFSPFSFHPTSLIAQLVKNPPAMPDTQMIPVSGRSPGEGIGYPLQYSWASLVAHLVKNLPAMRETRVWSLGWEEPPEKGKATHASILAWRIPGTTQSMGSQKVRHDWVTFTSLSIPLLHSTRLSKCTHFSFSFNALKFIYSVFIYCCVSRRMLITIHCSIQSYVN